MKRCEGPCGRQKADGEFKPVRQDYRGAGPWTGWCISCVTDWSRKTYQRVRSQIVRGSYGKGWGKGKKDPKGDLQVLRLYGKEGLRRQDPAAPF